MSDRVDGNTSEVINKVVITPDDVKGAAEFWPHFEVPMPPQLKTAFDAFVSDPSIENQEAIKLHITYALGFEKHEAFEDEMFNEIVKECRDKHQELSFDDALAAVLTESEHKDPK